MENDANYRLLCYLDLAMNPQPGNESAVNDVASHLLEALNYTPRGRLICTRKNIQLTICGERRNAPTDVCITDDLDIPLLIQEDGKQQ